MTGNSDWHHPYEDVQTWRETALIVTPLVVMTLLGGVLLTVGNQAPAIAVALLVTFNTAGWRKRQYRTVDAGFAAQNTGSA